MGIMSHLDVMARRVKDKEDDGLSHDTAVEVMANVARSGVDEDDIEWAYQEKFEDD